AVRMIDAALTIVAVVVRMIDAALTIVAVAVRIIVVALAISVVTIVEKIVNSVTNKYLLAAQICVSLECGIK
ncbi:hypothetical protein P4525_21630, partial [Peribacillus psychrosaccharolyticus]|uniref:hypothetical protein n=1 Tax=Peribacillus psychrosaccharolyticus TaxID=1407 RepID=UPI002E1AB745|nr:hypothetical protein [Peribacillus psychrosaccharolyticus]